MKQLVTRIKTIKGSFFLKYFLSYFCVFTVPFLLVIFVYVSSAGVISHQLSSQVTNMLEQTRSMTDASLQEMRSISLSLQSNETLQEFEEVWELDSSTGEEIFQAYKAIKSLPVYQLVNRAVDDLLIYFPGSTGEECFLISPQSAMRYTQDMEAVHLGDRKVEFVSLQNYLTQNTFYDTFALFDSPEDGITFVEEEDTPVSSPMVLYISGLNSYTGSHVTPTILVQISQNYLKEMLSSVTLEESGSAFIVNHTGDLVASFEGKGSPPADSATLDRLLAASENQKEDTFLFEGNQVTRVSSRYVDWTYYSVIPEKTIYRQLNHVRNIIALAAGGLILLGLLLCYLLTKRNSGPMKMIIRSLTSVYDHGRFDPEDDFKFIENAVSALVASNIAFHEKEKGRWGMVERDILWRLFLGDGIDSPDFQENLRASPLHLEEALLITGYLHVHGLDKSRQSAFFTQGSLTSMLSGLFPEPGKSLHPLVIDKSNLVFLAVLESGEEGDFSRELAERLAALGAGVERQMAYHLDFFLSDPFHLPENVQVGYQQCKDLALRVVKDRDQYVYTSADLPAVQKIYHYTIDQELRLVKLLKCGTREGLLAFLQDLYEQNFRQLQLSEGMRTNFFTAVQSSVIRSLSSVQLEKEDAALLYAHGTPASEEELSQYLLALQEAVQQSLRLSAGQETVEKKQAILDFIQHHYSDPGLVVLPLCEQLGCSESSLNKFIHDNLGLSFSDLLECTRLEAACSLLRQGGLTVKTIAEQTGYASDASFRRAFKRVLGVSPSEYVNSWGNQDNNRGTDGKSAEA
ncbi:MAG: helix-turn-helix domain-containing protein [Acutalibacter sp.]